jgi:F420-non-reducing hydrogenase small subunit
VYWAAACGGCDIAVLAIDDKILQVAEAFEIVFWPCVMDGKLEDVEALADGEIALCLWSGAVRSDEHLELAHLLRRKSGVLVAFGSCAQQGGIPGLANLTTREALLDTAYRDTPSTENPDGVRPQAEFHAPEGETLRLPVLLESVHALDQVVPVDYVLPGCPPEAERIWEALQAVLQGALPPRGSVIGAPSTVCEDCKRARHEKRIAALHRTFELVPDAETCLLEQGLVCCGIATRGGCGALCPQVAAPCLGCYGPPEGTLDQGARLLSGIASVIDSADPAEVERILAAGLPDPAGTFYRFGLARSLLRRARPASSPPNGARP